MNPAHDTIIAVGPRTFNVRREFGRIAAVEARFGSTAKLIDRIEAQDLTAVEMIDFYQLLLMDEPQPPSPEDIAAHVLEVGTGPALQPLYDFLGRAWVGDELWNDLAKRLAGGAAEDDDEGKGSRPGIDSLASRSSSDGGQINSGAQPTGNIL